MDEIGKAVEPILLAGKIMTESGSEIYRIEDTMKRMAQSIGLSNCHSYVTMTGVFISFSEPPYTLFLTAYNRTTDLAKVVAVNDLSRQLQNKQIDSETVMTRLQQLDHTQTPYTLFARLLASGVVSSSLMIIFGGQWHDFLPTFFIGMIGYGISQWLHKIIKINYFNYFVAAMSIALTTLLAQKVGIAFDIESIMVGALMPLVPGVAITNSFRDLLSGHMLGGVARGVDAIIIAGSIGSGIATVLMLWQ